MEERETYLTNKLIENGWELTGKEEVEMFSVGNRLSKGKDNLMLLTFKCGYHKETLTVSKSGIIINSERDSSPIVKHKYIIDGVEFIFEGQTSKTYTNSDEVIALLLSRMVN